MLCVCQFKFYNQSGSSYNIRKLFKYPASAWRSNSVIVVVNKRSINAQRKRMIMNRNIPYYLTAVGLFVLLKVGFSFADNNDLGFLLRPTDKLVGLVYGSQSVFLADHGFFHEKMNIVIEKSCSGFNYMILCFLLFAYLGLKYFDKQLHKIFTILTALFSAYLFTAFVNASRIISSIIVRNQTVGFFSEKQSLLHEAVGITTYFSFLVLTYYLTEKILKYIKYAKLA